MPKFFAELYRRDKVLALTGWLHVALFAVMLVASLFDSRTILGINAWIKPMKFAASITIYVWTIAWFLDYITGPRWAKRLISYGTSIAMVVEIVCIAGQSLRGTTSHFNIQTPFDGAIFSVMGAFIAFNLLLAALLLVLFFVRHVSLPRAYIWAIRWGLLLFIGAGLEGFVMVGHLGHSIGRTDAGPEPIRPNFEQVDGRLVNTAEILPDGGPGLPIVNFSTEGGDLRIAHAWGLHGLQIIPLVGFALSRRTQKAKSRPTAAMVAFAILYTLAGLFLFARALQGYPLIRL